MKALKLLLGLVRPSRPACRRAAMPRKAFTAVLQPPHLRRRQLRDRNDVSAPTFGEIDISLSFSTTIRFC